MGTIKIISHSDSLTCRKRKTNPSCQHLSCWSTVHYCSRLSRGKSSYVCFPLISLCYCSCSLTTEFLRPSPPRILGFLASCHVAFLYFLYFPLAIVLESLSISLHTFSDSSHRGFPVLYFLLPLANDSCDRSQLSCGKSSYVCLPPRVLRFLTSWLPSLVFPLVNDSRDRFSTLSWQEFLCLSPSSVSLHAVAIVLNSCAARVLTSVSLHATRPCVLGFLATSHHSRSHTFPLTIVLDSLVRVLMSVSQFLCLLPLLPCL